MTEPTEQIDRKQYYKQWRENNRERVNEYYKEWQIKNREHVNEYQRNYRKTKNEQIKKDLQKLAQLQQLLNNN